MMRRPPTSPLPLEFRAAAEGFLRARLGCGERSVEIRARQSFLFRQTFAQKDRKAADESIARACGVQSLDLERRNEVKAVRTRNYSASFAQGDDDFPHSLMQQKLRALFL